MSTLFTGFNILLMLLGFGLLIFIHELGHFLAAKWAGIRAEAFAVGMGPVVCSYRRGVGVSLGSTHKKVVAKTGKSAAELTDAELEEHGLDETEYSLRWIPIGGFVKMLGQEDANPAAVSSDPRSYGQCPIGKRMVVVSAGVIMNLILAAVLFVIAFMIGVPFPAPVVGAVRPFAPAATTVASNADLYGVSEPGLLPGDLVVRIGDKAAHTFADLQIASAMSRPDVAVPLEVMRSGIDEPLRFSMTPRKDSDSGLLSLGILPASTTRLVEKDEGEYVATILRESGLAEAGVGLGMRMESANGIPLDTWEGFQKIVDRSDGAAVRTRWVEAEASPGAAGVEALLAVEPTFASFFYERTDPPRVQNVEQGLFGLTPLLRIVDVVPGANTDVLRTGDVVLRVGDTEGPRMADFRQIVGAMKDEPVTLIVLRDGAEVEVTAHVNRKGLIGVLTRYAWDLPYAAEPMMKMRTSLGGDAESAVRTAVADLELPARVRFDAVAGTPVTDWATLREALRAETKAAHAAGEGATVELTVTWPYPDREAGTVDLALSADDVRTLHELSWATMLNGAIFDPIQVIRSADGNPLTAITMGLQHTHELVMLTYLTLDRLFRGSVGVEQLRGPVGIVQLGSKIVEDGFTYLLFFLAMISVNLAVINFLPFPVVDGGLFLFLIYEKLKGRPPSIAFQNAATLVGVFLIATVLVVVTWNDVSRMLG